VGRLRPQTNRSKISYRKRSTTWGKARRISFLMHFGYIGPHTKPHRHVTIPASIREKLPLTSRARTPSSLGNQELEYGRQASQQKSTEVDCRARRMAWESLSQCQALQRKNQKMARSSNQAKRVTTRKNLLWDVWDWASEASGNSNHLS
jgi:hypothetical protein